MTFTLATWNVLATAYIRPRFYPYTPAACLDPAWRVPELVRRAKSLDADILCLQEVETEVFRAMESALAEIGYEGAFALKAGRRPDGCATFFRARNFTLTSSGRIEYADAGVEGANSGHIALLHRLEQRGRPLHILNTHLKWDPPGKPPEQQWGYRQISEAILALEPCNGAAQIVCGDLNVTPNSDVAEALEKAAFDYTHRGRPLVFTCNSNREPKLIDHIFWRGPLSPFATWPREISAETPLPSPEEPSDHVPLLARFE